MGFILHTSQDSKIQAGYKSLKIEKSHRNAKLNFHSTSNVSTSDGAVLPNVDFIKNVEDEK